MGIYDRDYERDQSYGSYGNTPGMHVGGAWTFTTKLVIFTFAIYGVQLLTQPAQANANGWFTDFFSLHADVLKRPWLAFELLTYGFLHSTSNLQHILFNMLGLWMFGRSVEHRYGRKEYLAYYLWAVVFAGLAWVVSVIAYNRGDMPAFIQMLGASGGVSAVLLLFAMNFPHQKVFIWGVLPMPAWAFALLFVGLDLWGALGRGNAEVAYTAHLGGALFAVLYFRYGWQVSNWLPGVGRLPKLGPRPKLRVHDPLDEDKADEDSEVDAILRKIQEQGQDSLTRRERKILEQASRDYQRRRQ